MLDVRRLQMLREVARAGSLSGAARTLGYTQPAVSHHIARLEAEAGTALLSRLGRGVKLTDAGLALVAHADAVLSRLDAAAEEVAEIAGLRAGRVRLSAFPSGSATLMAAALAGLRERHPGVEVTFVESEPEDALPLLRGGELDMVLGFSYAGGSHDGRDFATVPLLHDPTHAVLPGGHGGRGPVSLEALAEETWIAGCVRCRRHLLQVAGGAGFAPRIGFETDDYVTVQSLIAAELGVALLPALALCSLRRPDVVVRPVLGEPARRVEVVLNAAERRPPAVTAMVAALQAAAHDLARRDHAHALGLRAV